MGDYDTLTDMMDRVRDGLADHTDTFFSPTEIRVSVNEGIWEIYKSLHSQNIGMFFVSTPETITIDSTTTYYDLVNDFAWVDEIRPVDPTLRYIKFYFKSRHDDEFRDLFNYPDSVIVSNAGTYFFDIVSNKTLLIVPKVFNSFDVEIYTVQDPVELANPGDIPTLKVIFRPIAVEYAVRKLKGKEETGEYTSHDQLLQFILNNTAKYTAPRGGTNLLMVEEYMG